MRHLQKKVKTGTLNLNQDDPFELFIAATSIRYCYYKETHKILGNTYGMCVLQVSQRCHNKDRSKLCSVCFKPFYLCRTLKLLLQTFWPEPLRL